MAQAEGKSISELGSAIAYMDPNDLALISQKQSNGSYTSKAVSKAAFEKLTISGERDASTRTASSYKVLQFVDSSSAHLGSGYLQHAFWEGGANATQIIAQKKCGTETKSGILAVVVNPNGSRYGYCTAEGFGIGPSPTSASGPNVYIQGSAGSIELRPSSEAAHGGYIDFHYQGNSGDYTSRLIEGPNDFQVIAASKNIVVKANDSGKQVVLNAAANQSTLANSPTQGTDAKNSKAIATVGWVASNFLPTSDLFDDPTELIEALDGLLNKQDLVIYVDSTSTLEASGNYVLKSINSKTKGVFLTKDAPKQTPVKTIYDAIKIARKIKFLEDANCYIRLLTDQEFKKQADNSNLVESFDLSHPDLVQNKCFYVCGWTGGSNYNATKHEYTGTSGDAAVRKISVDLTTPARTLDKRHYVSLIITRSKTIFRHIAFYGKLRMTHFNDGSRFYLKSDYKYDSCFVKNNGSDEVKFEKCMIRGCDVGYCGPHGCFQNTTFSFVNTCIHNLAGQRTDIYLGLNVNNCYRFIYADSAATFLVSVGSTPCKWKIYTAESPIIVGNGGTGRINLYTSVNDIALIEDAAGTIKIDGMSYSRAPSAGTATKVNTNIAAFEVGSIAPISITAVVKVKKTANDSSTDQAKAFMKWFINQETQGYSDNGFIKFDYGARNWLSMYTKTTAPWADNEIPDGGTISF